VGKTNLLKGGPKKKCDSTSVIAPSLVVGWTLVHLKQNWCSHGG
jgi:hypothetical protein